MPARAMPTMTMRCGPGSSIRMPRSSEQKPCPAISSHDSRIVGPATDERSRGGRIASIAPRARRAPSPASSGNSASPALPSRSFAASAGWSTPRLIPITPPMRESWKPKPSWIPGVNPAARTARNDGSPPTSRRLASAATSTGPRCSDSAPFTPSGRIAEPAVADDRAGVEMGAHRARRQHADDDRRRRGVARVADHQRRRLDVHSRAGPTVASSVTPSGARHGGGGMPGSSPDGHLAEHVGHEAIAQGVGGGRPPGQRGVELGRGGERRVDGVGRREQLGERGVAAAAQRRHDEVCVATDLPSHVTATVVPAARDCQVIRSRTSREQTL